MADAEDRHHGTASASRRAHLRAALRGRSALRQAFLLMEILAPPLAIRRHQRPEETRHTRRLQPESPGPPEAC